MNPDAEVICYRCHRKGHRKRDCRTVEKDKGKECENAVEQTPVQAAEANPVQSATPAWISMIELDEWILMVNMDDHEAQVGSIERVVVDSGAAVSVCPLGYAPEIPVASQQFKKCDENRVWSTDRARQKMVEFEDAEDR